MRGSGRALRSFLQSESLMPEGLYRGNPLSSEEREEFERDLISFCDRALGLLGDIRGLDVLYAGGVSALWIEGLAGLIGPEGSLTALDADAGSVEEARRWVPGAELPCWVDPIAGDVFAPPLAPGSFDLVYSAGLFHELDVRERPAEAALSALAATLRTGGRLATDDFVDSVPAAQLEDEAVEDALRRMLYGGEPYGIGPPERMVALHEGELGEVRRRALPPFGIRHMDRVFLAADELEGMDAGIRGRWRALRERVRREGYTRPATLYIEGYRAG